VTNILVDMCSSVINLGTFRRNLLSPSSGQKSEDGAVGFLRNGIGLRHYILQKTVLRC
jgi:hypothetical protein